ncbi:hypothetical protein T439DRAFT_320066 [Meredithblackwellia eburnea MCA 4105]
MDVKVKSSLLSSLPAELFPAIVHHLLPTSSDPLQLLTNQTERFRLSLVSKEFRDHVGPQLETVVATGDHAVRLQEAFRAGRTTPAHLVLLFRGERSRLGEQFAPLLAVSNMSLKTLGMYLGDKPISGNAFSWLGGSIMKSLKELTALEEFEIHPLKREFEPMIAGSELTQWIACYPRLRSLRISITVYIRSSDSFNIPLHYFQKFPPLSTLAIQISGPLSQKSARHPLLHSLLDASRSTLRSLRLSVARSEVADSPTISTSPIDPSGPYGSLLKAIDNLSSVEDLVLAGVPPPICLYFVSHLPRLKVARIPVEILEEGTSSVAEALEKARSLRRVSFRVKLRGCDWWDPEAEGDAALNMMADLSILETCFKFIEKLVGSWNGELEEVHLVGVDSRAFARFGLVARWEGLVALAKGRIFVGLRDGGEFV